MLKGIFSILILLALCSCGGIRYSDAQYTWDMMCDEYKVKDRPMPKIVYIDEYRENAEGFPIYGVYNHPDTITFYRGFGYSVLEHEFHHALGNDLGEYSLPFPTRRN